LQGHTRRSCVARGLPRGRLTTPPARDVLVGQLVLGVSERSVRQLYPRRVAEGSPRRRVRARGAARRRRSSPRAAAASWGVITTPDESACTTTSGFTSPVFASRADRWPLPAVLTDARSPGCSTPTLERSNPVLGAATFGQAARNFAREAAIEPRPVASLLNRIDHRRPRRMPRRRALGRCSGPLHPRRVRYRVHANGSTTRREGR
jgi:hypothetical protein